jgi:hypothetical protein
MVENYCICEAWFGASKGNRYFLKTRNNKFKKGFSKSNTKPTSNEALKTLDSDRASDKLKSRIHDRDH